MAKRTGLLDYQEQGGVRNYAESDGGLVGPIPRQWRSHPSQPETLLAYITPKEADALRRLNVNKKADPEQMGLLNTGPGGIPSYDAGGMGYGGGESGSYGGDEPGGGPSDIQQAAEFVASIPHDLAQADAAERGYPRGWTADDATPQDVGRLMATGIPGQPDYGNWEEDRTSEFEGPGFFTRIGRGISDFFDTTATPYGYHAADFGVRGGLDMSDIDRGMTGMDFARGLLSPSMAVLGYLNRQSRVPEGTVDRLTGEVTPYPDDDIGAPQRKVGEDEYKDIYDIGEPIPYGASSDPRQNIWRGGPVAEITGPLDTVRSYLPDIRFQPVDPDEGFPDDRNGGDQQAGPIPWWLLPRGQQAPQPAQPPVAPVTLAESVQQPPTPGYWSGNQFIFPRYGGLLG